jgi:ornithine carbamoyltransferase
MQTEHAPDKTQKAAAKEALRQVIIADQAHWRKRSLITLWDVTPEQIRTLLHVAAEMKTHDLARETSLYWEYPRTLAMLFEKPSLRTRVSFEVSMAHLEGHAIYLAPDDVGLGKREAVADVAGALSRWVDAITARVFKHETVEELAQHATIPVINALSDREHPIQAFADLLTLQEQKGMLGNGLKLAYVGDGNNVLHALLLGCAKVGVHLSAGCPEGYQPSPDYVAEAQRIGAETGARIEITIDPVEAVRDADAIYTDVWTSMGQEAEKEARLQLFTPYRLDAALVAQAKPDAIVLHCLPAHRGEEIADEVMDRFKTVILDEAENRLHTQKALLALILGL